MKKFSKVLCCILGLGFLLTGCATVGNIKNDNKELIYNGNSAVMVDGHLYYGNAFADYSSFSSDSDYKKSAQLAYLARLNTNVELSAKTEDYSPKNVEKVAEEVVGQSKNFMFVLGNYIYYATPNRQRIKGDDGKSKHYFNYTALYRSKLNGDGKQKIYTTAGEISDIQVLKYENKYYVVMLAGTDLVKIQLGNDTKTTVVAKDVKSVAIPKTKRDGVASSTYDWNGYVYFTVDNKDEDNSDISGSIVKRVLISSKDEEKLTTWSNGTTVSFIGREKDQLFFTMSGHETEVFTADVSDHSETIKNFDTNTKFYSASTISNISLIATEAREYGYVFTTSSGALAYGTKAGKCGAITLKNGDDTISSFKVLFVKDRTVFLSTTSGIYSADLSAVFNDNAKTVSCTTIVTMTSIYDGTLYAYDGTYIYYYAKLEEVKTDESKEDDKSDTKTETDDNYYLYRTKVSKSSSADAGKAYELLGLTKIKSRRTK